MTTRKHETALLARCAYVAKHPEQSALNQQEANVFRLAAMVVHSKFLGESAALLRASEQYFASHPTEKLPAADVVRKGWVLSLPRLRDMLSHCLQGY